MCKVQVSCEYRLFTCVNFNSRFFIDNTKALESFEVKEEEEEKRGGGGE
jgi:hypothetical protein